MAVTSITEISNTDKQQLINLVKQVLKGSVTQQRLIKPQPPASALLLQNHACFVTLYNNQQLRGCIGTYQSSRPLWLNVCQYSYSSACEDSRFQPITESELQDIEFEISILSELSSIENCGEQQLIDELQVGIDGLLLKEQWHSAIFLPTVWHSLPTAKLFLQQLKRKAGWPDDYWSNQIQLFRFSTQVISSIE